LAFFFLHATKGVQRRGFLFKKKKYHSTTVRKRFDDTFLMPQQNPIADPPNGLAWCLGVSDCVNYFDGCDRKKLRLCFFFILC
jgi:hypothetical protein